MRLEESLEKSRETFERDGFVCVRQFLDAREFDELETNWKRYVRDVVPGLPPSDAFFEEPGRPETLKQMQNIEKNDPFFHAFCARPKFTQLAEALLGGPVTFQNAESFIKPAGTGRATPPHQDGYYFCLEPNHAATLWFALDRVDESNGCLRYVAGSHRDGVRPHGASQVLGFSQGITDWGPNDAARERPTALDPGDVLAHHSLTIHRADANTGARPRRALGLVFYSAEARRDDAAFGRYQAAVQEQHRKRGLATSD
jgi:phytanoyl-CoA hydroxylase